MNLVKISVSMFFLVSLTILSGCTSAATSFDDSSRLSDTVETVAVSETNLQNLPLQTSHNSEGQIMAGDVLEISVYQVGELDRNVRVEQDGTISLLLIGQVQTAGKTVQELENELERIYGVNYLQNPEISVFVIERSADS